MKALARSYIWWSNIDDEIEEAVQRCATCQQHQKNPLEAPAHPWEFPSGPWERLHIDHAGPVNGKMFLVIVDAYSKWIEVEVTKSTDAQSTVKILRKLFSVHGLPRVLVSDNGPGFASEELNEFLKLNGVKHLYSAPYHPASNGQAERTVRTFKETIKKLQIGDIETRLCRFLFRYRVTPHTLTGPLLQNCCLSAGCVPHSPNYDRKHVLACGISNWNRYFPRKLGRFRLERRYSRRILVEEISGCPELSLKFWERPTTKGCCQMGESFIAMWISW